MSKSNSKIHTAHSKNHLEEAIFHLEECSYRYEEVTLHIEESMNHVEELMIRIEETALHVEEAQNHTHLSEIHPSFHPNFVVRWRPLPKWTPSRPAKARHHLRDGVHLKANRIPEPKGWKGVERKKS